MSAALGQALRDGPTPVPVGIRRCEEILAAGLVDQQAEILVTLHLAYLHALAAEGSRARELGQQARLRLADLGGGAVMDGAQMSLTIGRVELLMDNAAAAAKELQRSFDTLGDVGERYFRPLIGALLAQATYTDGQREAAVVLADHAELIAADDDVEAHVLLRCVRAKALARRGATRQALTLCRRAIEMVDSVDAPVMQGDTFADLATVLILADRMHDAADALGRARELYLLKEALASVRKVDTLLAGIEALLYAEGAQVIQTSPGATQRRHRRKLAVARAGRSGSPRSR